MVPASGETLIIIHACTFTVVIQFELCFGCRCFPLSCQWPKCEGSLSLPARPAVAARLAELCAHAGIRHGFWHRNMFRATLPSEEQTGELPSILVRSFISFDSTTTSFYLT